MERFLQEEEEYRETYEYKYNQLIQDSMNLLEEALLVRKHETYCPENSSNTDNYKHLSDKKNHFHMKLDLGERSNEVIMYYDSSSESFHYFFQKGDVSHEILNCVCIHYV